jgi:hypothetical protein
VNRVIMKLQVPYEAVINFSRTMLLEVNLP